MKQALIVVDMQKGFESTFWGRRNNPHAERNGLALLDAWRARGWRVAIVRHDSTDPASPLRPGQPGNDLKPGFEPRSGDWLINKRVNAAFIGTDLEARLRAEGIGAVAIFGLTTDQCVSTTVRMACNLGFITTLVEDACACFEQSTPGGARLSAAEVQLAHVTSLHTEFARVLTAGELIASLWQRRIA